MKTQRLCLAVLVAALVLAPAGPAGAVGVSNPNPDATPLCIGLKTTGLGAPNLTLTLFTVAYGPFVNLSGQGRFSNPSLGPPNSLVIYGVTGTAIPNEEGWWISLEGTGYDLAKTIFRGTFGIQFNDDNPSLHTLSYTKQSLNGSSSSTVTGVAEVVPCG